MFAGQTAGVGIRLPKPSPKNDPGLAIIAMGCCITAAAAAGMDCMPAIECDAEHIASGGTGTDMAIRAMLEAPPHSLHALRTRPCSQMEAPPHSLHTLR